MLIEFPRRDLAWAARRNLADHLRPGSAGGRGSHPRTQRFLIAAEVAVAVVLVVSGGLLLRSLNWVQIAHPRPG